MHLALGWPPRDRKVRREDAQKSAAGRNKGCRLYGSKSCVLRNRSARSKICIGHHVFDDNGPLLPRRPAAGRDVIGLHALEELQKFAMEAVLRLDCDALAKT